MNLSSKITYLGAFIRYYWQAKTIRKIQNPFIKAFAKAIIEDKRTFYCFPLIELYRHDLLEDMHILPSIDYGAPSKTQNRTRTVRSIVQHTAVSPRIGRYLFKIIHTYKPDLMLELGTASGLSAMYQAPAALAGDLISVDASPYLCKIAEENIETMGLPNVNIINALFEDVIEGLVEEGKELDYIFIDGHHKGKARTDYFKKLLPLLHDQSILVFSDIYWSKEMQAAWHEIRQHPRVSMSIDLFEIGVLFFDSTSKEKHHTKLIPSIWKPLG